MPSWKVTVRHLAEPSFIRTFILSGPSKELVETGLAERFDKREWGWDVFAYSVNGEDF